MSSSEPAEVGGEGPDRPASDEVPAAGAPPRRKARPIFLVIGIVVALALAVGLFSSGSSSGPGRPHTGGAVPTFSLPRLGGGTTVGVPADGGGGGRPAILLFFASWCTPCQAEIPALAATYHEQQSSGSRLAKVAVVGIDGSDPTSNALAFVHSSGVTFPVGADRTYTVTEGLFAFTELPESVFVQANGTIAGIHYGTLSSDQFVSWEHRLLTTG